MGRNQILTASVVDLRHASIAKPAKFSAAETNDPRQTKSLHCLGCVPIKPWRLSSHGDCSIPSAAYVIVADPVADTYFRYHGGAMADQDHSEGATVADNTRAATQP